MPLIDLSDDHLFGNEAAEDEPADVFDAYAYVRPEVEPFCDPKRTIQIVRAYKGEGKSALMRIARSRIEGQGAAAAIAIDTTGPSVSPDLATTDFPKWVRSWKEHLVALIASEIGARINLAWSDDAVALVELAEKNGFRSRNFVSTIVDRLQTKSRPSRVV